MRIKIKITITREPSKIGIYLRLRFNKVKDYIIIKYKKFKELIKMPDEIEKSKLTLFLEENKISEDYVLGVLVGMGKKEPDEEEEEAETPEEPETPETPEEPEKPESPEEPDVEIPVPTIKEIIEATIKETLKVKRKPPPKKEEHTKTPPKYADRPEVYI